jgi:glyoxylase-like metal-dependent hydrolase (beta-lactamase superfamily II)
MSQKRMFVLSFAASIYLAVIGVPALLGQGGGGGGRGGGQRGAAAADPVKKAVQIKPDLWYIADGGANSVVEVTPQGLILGDTKNPGAEIEAALIAEIKSISPLPVKYVFNTHPHGDHISHNQYFVDQGATVVGLKHLKEVWEAGNLNSTPGKPSVVFDKDYDLKFGGTEVEAHYFGSAHTDADTIVFFKNKKFVMLSDLVNFANPSPGISGTNAVQVPGILDKVLKLDFDTAIAGRGPLLKRADVEAYQKTWNTFMTRVKDAVKAGATKETLASQVKQDDLFSPGLTAPWAFNANFFSQLFDALKSNPN